MIIIRFDGPDFNHNHDYNDFDYNDDDVTDPNVQQW